MSLHQPLHHPDWRARLRGELTEWRPWITRGVVLAFAAAAGLVVAGFTWLAEMAFHQFQRIEQAAWWAPLLWMPLATAVIVWLTRRFLPGAAGSGIPQVVAAMEDTTPAGKRGLYVSMKLAIGKVVLTSGGLLAGLSLGREGPSVQIAAGVMHSARRWLPDRHTISEHGLLMAGGAAGIAAAFNTPLGGVMFAIEELWHRREQRSSALLISAIVLAGLMAVSIYGNNSYFGRILVPQLGWSLFGPGLLIAVVCGLAGGLFSRLLIVSLAGGKDIFSRQRARAPVRFAAGCALLVAVIGVVTQGATFGSGYEQTKVLLEGERTGELLYTPLKLIATWLTTWTGVPAGVFAPSLAVGAGIGSDVAALIGFAERPALIALGMAGFLAAVTQAPLTAFIIVMEMINGHSMVLSLMACALIASGISRLISAPLYPALARLQLLRLGVPLEPEKKGAHHTR
ncbi:chloride channel protein [Rubrivivax albus]|uniref:chloride channel protein n=1 Tax=Rubrivivax albus TaxID=2499835 RepID=UPI00268B7B19